MASTNDARNRRIVDMRRSGMQGRAILAALKPEYPRITRQVVHGVLRRHGFSRPVDERCKSTYAHGEAAGHAKLTEADVTYIRRWYRHGCPDFGARALAKRFDVNPTTIKAAVDGVTWAHLDDPEVSGAGL